MSFLGQLEQNLGLSKRSRPEYREAARLQEEEDKRAEERKKEKARY